MVTADNSNGGYGYAQVGYGKFGGNNYPAHTGLYEYAQWIRRCDITCDFNDKFGGHPNYASATFNTSYKSFDSHIHMYIDSTQLAESGWDPVAAWNANWQAQFFGETKYNETDMPGTFSNRVRFLDNEKATSGSGDWVEFDSLNNGSSGVNRYHFETTGTHSDFKIWTHPLDSL